MVDTITTLGKSAGGGAPSYFSGKESFHADLAGGTLVLALTDMRKTHLLYSSVDGAKVQLLAGNAAGLTTGLGLGFRVFPGSKPIRIINAGVAGTDPILEAFLLPGADYAFFANAIGTARGDWRGTGRGAYHGAVPVSVPNTEDPGVDFGSVMGTASMHGDGNLSAILPNLNFSRLSSTLYVACGIPNAGTSVVVYAISYNPATDAWTWGAPATAFSSANQWSYPLIIGLNATTYAILAWEATAAKVSARAATVAGTVITQGATIQSGAWTVNPSNSGATKIASLVADSASSFFWSSYGGTGFGIEHFSVAGTTLTRDGGVIFAGASYGTSRLMGGSSSAANVLEIGVSSDTSTLGGISRYTYNAGAVTLTWNRKSKINGLTNNSESTLICADPTNRVYYKSISAAAQLSRFVLNAGGTDFTENEGFYAPSLANSVAPSLTELHNSLFISDDEAIVFTSNPNFGGGSHNGSLTLFNPLLGIRIRASVSAGTSSDSGFCTHLVPAQLAWSPYWSAMLGVDLNSSIRRLAFLYVNQSQSLAAGRHLALAMYDLPRNYDQAIS